MRGVLQELADLAAAASDGEQRTVPDVGTWALTDQLAVLVAAARAAGVADDVLQTVLRDLAHALGVRSSA